MKRHLPSIDWSLCCICEGGDLRSTNDGIKNLSSNLLKHWEDEVLDFHPERIANYKNGKPDFEGSMLGNNAKYHHDCTRKYTDYKRERK